MKVCGWCGTPYENDEITVVPIQELNEGRDKELSDAELFNGPCCPHGLYPDEYDSRGTQ